MDQDYFPFLAAELKRLSTAAGPRGLLFKCSLGEATALLNRAAGAVYLAEKLSLYQCRHGGAAHDLNARTRARDAVKARGRWRTECSLRRYGKIGKVQALLRNLPAEALRYCEASTRVLDEVIAGRRCPLRPPGPLP